MSDDFKYFLVDDFGRSYYEDSSGNIAVSGQPVPLKSTPDGWQEASIKYGRSNGKPGIIRAFGINIKFVKDGAKILKSLMYRVKGVQAAVNLILMQLDRSASAFGVYQDLFTGAPDMSSFLDADHGVTVDIMERGLSELIKANEDTTYEIPIEVPEAITINWDGIILISEVRLQNYKDYIQSGEAQVPNVRYSNWCNIGLIVVPSETVYPSLLFNISTQYKDSNDPADFEGQWVMKCTATTQLVISSGVIEFFWVGSSDVQVLWQIYNRANGSSRNIVINSSITPGFTSLSIAGTYTFNADEEIYLVTLAHDGSPAKSISFAWPPYDDPNGAHDILLSYTYRKPTTDVKALRGLYVFQQLIGKITDGKYQGESSLLLTYNDFVLTSGDGIRALPGAVIKTSLNQFIKSFNTFTAGEFGITPQDANKRAVFESEDYFYNQNWLIDLDEVQGLQVSPNMNYRFNSIKIGWPNQNYEDVNGRDEPLTTYEWSTPVTRYAKQIDLVSIYRADPIGAEITRINLTNKTTTDSTSDNDTFVINIESSPVDGRYRLNRPVFDSITGVLSPTTIFNILLSVKRCLLTHSAKIAAAMEFLDADYIKFQTANKNDKLVTISGTSIIAEKADVQIGALPKKAIWKAIDLKFNTKVPLRLKTIIEADPYAKIRFKWQGALYVGYILDCGQVPELDPAQQWTLLCAAESDLTKLINVV